MREVFNGDRTDPSDETYKRTNNHHKLAMRKIFGFPVQKFM